jgi:hypothetical protein
MRVPRRFTASPFVDMSVMLRSPAPAFSMMLVRRHVRGISFEAWWILDERIQRVTG